MGPSTDRTVDQNLSAAAGITRPLAASPTGSSTLPLERSADVLLHFPSPQTLSVSSRDDPSAPQATPPIPPGPAPLPAHRPPAHCTLYYPPPAGSRSTTDAATTTTHNPPSPQPALSGHIWRDLLIPVCILPALPAPDVKRTPSTPASLPVPAASGSPAAWPLN